MSLLDEEVENNEPRKGIVGMDLRSVARAKGWRARCEVLVGRVALVKV